MKDEPFTPLYNNFFDSYELFFHDMGEYLYDVSIGTLVDNESSSCYLYSKFSNKFKILCEKATVTYYLENTKEVFDKNFQLLSIPYISCDEFAKEFEETYGIQIL